MKTETVLKKRDAAVTALRDQFSSVRHFGATSDQLNESVLRILAKHLDGAPQWSRAYFDGWRAALTAQLYDSHLMFGGLVDGTFYSTHSDRDDYYQKNGIEPAAFADNGKVQGRGHYWKHNGKPFFVA